jgi:hypothetical protein
MSDHSFLLVLVLVLEMPEPSEDEDEDENDEEGQTLFSDRLQALPSCIWYCLGDMPVARLKATQKLLVLW